MSKECKTMIESFCGSEKIKTPFVEGQGIDISYNEEKEVVISSTGGGTADINQGTGIAIDNQTNTVSFDMPPWIVQDYENMGVIYSNGVAVFNGNIRFRYGTEPPFTFLQSGTSLPLPIVANNGIVVDVSEDGMSLEIHAERQQVTTTFANLFTELNNLTTQTKTIKSISFSPSKDISVNTNNFKLSSSGITTETSTDTVFLSGQSYVLYPSQLPDPNNASYAFNLQATGVRSGTLDIATNNISVQFARFWTPTTNDLNILFGNTQSIDTQISTESVVIEYE